MRRLVWILVLLAGCKEVIDLEPPPADAALGGDATPFIDAGFVADGG
jgi:hypothetical protein